MERVMTEPDRLSEEMSKCKRRRESSGEPNDTTVPACPREDNRIIAQLGSDPVGHSRPQKTAQRNDKSPALEKPLLSEDCCVSLEASDKSGASCSSGAEKILRPCGTPLRLRRLPASFWQEPNVPKDHSGKLMPSDGCFGSCGCHFHRPTFQKDASFGYGDYDILTGFRSKYLDPVSPPDFHRPGHSFASISKFSGDSLELTYLDAAAAPWRQGTTFFPSASPAPRCDLRPPVFGEGPGSAARTAFSATAALYGHMMRRSLHGNYHHSNDALADHLVSPIATDGLWRLLPNRPLSNNFSKRFHPYL